VASGLAQLWLLGVGSWSGHRKLSSDAPTPIKAASKSLKRLRALALSAPLLKQSSLQSMPSRIIVFSSVVAALVMLPPNKFVEVFTLPPLASALKACVGKAIKMQPNNSEMEKHGLAFMARKLFVCDLSFDLCWSARLFIVWNITQSAMALLG
jgi:hypothetical protein